MTHFIRAIALATLPFALPAAAQDRPVFKQPFMCAQSWDASTYDTHGPEGISRFDMNRKRDIITAYQRGNRARLFFYGTDRGDSATFGINAQGDGLDRIASFDWQGGWR